MADEQQFIEQGLRRSQIDEFFADELGRAGYGGMEMAPTPMGIQIVLKAEKPGMVIGKGGKNIRKITRELNERFDLEDPQIDVQEVDEPDLNARIVADRLANALERGWYFRKAGHTTVDRIMEAGALGAEIVLAGKVTGNRGRVEKFNRGYIKHNGEPAEEIVDEGQSVAVMQLGTIGVTVKIIPPGADLPDDFAVADDADVSDLVAEEDSEGVEELLEGEPEGDFDASDVPDEADEGRPSPGEGTADPVEFPDEEEIVEEVDEGRAPTSTNEEDVEEELDDLEAEIDAEVDEEAAAEAADLVDEMETDETEDDEE